MKNFERIRFKGGYKYKIVDDAGFLTYLYPEKDIDTTYITLSTDGTLTVKAGYAFDGPSGPTIDTKNFMRGSLCHDALYQLMRDGYLHIHNDRKLADQMLRDICRKDGMSKIRSWWVYKAVRLAAENSSINGRKVKIAP